MDLNQPPHFVAASILRARYQLIAGQIENMRAYLDQFEEFDEDDDEFLAEMVAKYRGYEDTTWEDPSEYDPTV